jgi:hypothetical protein
MWIINYGIFIRIYSGRLLCLRQLSGKEFPLVSFLLSDLIRNAYVVLQYIVQQSYSIERKEEE